MSDQPRKEHELKTEIQLFTDAWALISPFQVRLNDRDFAIGDRLILREYDGENYTGRSIAATIYYILDWTRFPDGLKEGYVVLAIGYLNRSLEPVVGVE